ncbi:PfkB family carbohydrate kinase, partial [Escherichia coli]|uniref:PfkB family carbohydrate kinase n=1 Tax=Escherichia coli TaxID=562 RepID=UPI00210EEB6D
PSGELVVEWLEKQQDVTPFIDFGPRNGDIPDSLLARIMACRPLVSLNRQEAEIAAERFALSAEITTLGKQWLEKFAAPLIVRLDKEGAWYFSNDASGCIPAFPTQVVERSLCPARQYIRRSIQPVTVRFHRRVNAIDRVR